MNKNLIIIDMQNDFVDGSLGTKEAQLIVENVKNELEKCLDEGYEVLATQDTHFDNYLNTFEGKNLPVPHCIENSKGWEIVEPIKEMIPKENIFKKITFGSEDLISYLKEKKPEEIELVGLCTDICVLSNAIMIRAALPETEIFVKEDCCAGVTPDLHKSALDVMKSNQIKVI